MTQELEKLTFGATVKTIGMPDVRSLSISVPPYADQVVLVRYIREMIAKIDDELALSQSSITLLQERRAALISAAVTGKIDVRGLGPAVEEAA
jgi:type I restriction enzyme S subunit